MAVIGQLAGQAHDEPDVMDPDPVDLDGKLPGLRVRRPVDRVVLFRA